MVSAPDHPSLIADVVVAVAEDPSKVPLDAAVQTTLGSNLEAMGWVRVIATKKMGRKVRGTVSAPECVAYEEFSHEGCCE
jgi:hypothetical protein